MRVAFLSTSGHLGGAEVSLRDILASLRRARPDWRLLLITPGDGRLVSEATRLEVETRVLPYPPALARFGERGAGGLTGVARFLMAAGTAPGYIRHLRAALVAARPDVVHANGLKAHLVAAVATPSDAALVWHIHDYLRSRRLSARLLRLLAGRCDTVVANSDSVAADVRGVFGRRVDVTRMYNGVDLDRFRPEGPVLDLDRQAGLPPAPAGTVRVGLVAVMAGWKGHDLFLEALARVGPDQPVRGYVVGGPIYDTEKSQRTLAELRARAAALGLEGRVGFTGFVDEPARAMRALDVVVHASVRPEPFGLVIAEAQACGRAVIATRAGGAAELVDHGVDGLTFGLGDVNGLVAAIRRLAGDPELRARLGETAATRASRYDRWRLSETLVPLYTRLAERYARP